MSNAKKAYYSSRGAICNIILALLIAIYPILIFRSFIYSLLYLIILATFSSLNMLTINRKTIFVIFPISFSISDDANAKEKISKRAENKEFSVYAALIILFSSTFIFAIISILLGASVNEEIVATLYFSLLMTFLTIYPLIWYYFFCDSITTVLRILTESKFESILEIYFQSIIIWTTVGAWVGAFPIPLDWDRPWQKWPITCCIGASLGNSLAHFVTGFKFIYIYFRDKRKVMIHRPV